MGWNLYTWGWNLYTWGWNLFTWGGTSKHWVEPLHLGGGISTHGV